MIPNRESIPEFLNQNGLTGYGAEIGVQKAEYSTELLSKWNGKKLYLIDSWRHIASTNRDVSNVNHNGHLQSLAQTFIQVYPYGTKACLIRELSVEAADLFSDGFFDFVYIDAAHDYQSVLSDLEAWVPKVKKGGYVFGHDYLDLTYEQNGCADLEVKRAAEDYARIHGYSISVIEDPFPTFYFLR